MTLKRLLLVAATAAAVMLPSAALAQEVIRDFSVDATLTSDRLLRIRETITYDFGEAEKHGIYRYIPVKYVRYGANYDYRPRVTGVTLDGGSVPYDVTNEAGLLYLKIGDPDATITGAHVYAITYETDRAVTFFSDHSELYWNVTGNEWPVPIAQSSFTVALPSGADASSTRTACFTGQTGSEESSCTVVVDDGKAVFGSTRVLLPEEGMTVVIGMPLGLIRPPTAWEVFLMFVSDNYAFFIPFVAFALMFYLWRNKGRDPKLGTVIPLYEPPERFTPAEIVCAREESTVPPAATTATIIDLARRGFLKIRYDKPGYAFLKTAKALDDASLKDDEKAILDGLFKKGAEVSITDLQVNKFYEAASEARKAVTKRILDLGLFDKNPVLVRATYVGLGCVVWFLLIFFLMTTPFGFAVAIMTGIIVIVFGWFMPRRTDKGVKILAEIKGFEWFLTVTEKDRLAFHNAPAKTPEEFMEFLPYAVALGLEKEWAKQFEGMEIPQPDWAEGQGWSHLGAIAFVSSVDSMHSQAASSGYSAPSSAGSGGSGFSGGGSGGGGGGGGGGSW